MLTLNAFESTAAAQELVEFLEELCGSLGEDFEEIEFEATFDNSGPEPHLSCPFRIMARGVPLRESLRLRAVRHLPSATEWLPFITLMLVHLDPGQHNSRAAVAWTGFPEFVPHYVDRRVGDFLSVHFGCKNFTRFSH